VLSTLRTRFGIDSLNPRMAATADLSSCIDPGRLALSSPPRLGQEARFDMHRDLLRACCSWENSQEEIELALRTGQIPERYIDRRPVEERMAAWLGPAQDLGVLRILT
jgi:hypothetical protein